LILIAFQRPNVTCITPLRPTKASTFFPGGHRITSSPKEKRFLFFQETVPSWAGPTRLPWKSLRVGCSPLVCRAPLQFKLKKRPGHRSTACCFSFDRVGAYSSVPLVRSQTLALGVALRPVQHPERLTYLFFSDRLSSDKVEHLLCIRFTHLPLVMQ